MTGDAIEVQLAELVELLERYGEARWADWLAADLRAIRKGDACGLDHLLQAFGGMGSINDLVIHPVNGHRIDAVEIDTVNRRLDALREQIWIEGNALRHGERGAGH